MKVVFCHHAERERGKSFNSQNDSITSLGKKDAEIVSKLIKKLDSQNKIKAVFSSPYLRCMETAKIVTKGLSGISIETDERLNEFKSKVVETWVEFQNRINDFLIEKENEFEKDDVIVCFTSGLNIVGFINWSYGLSASENAPYLGVPSCSPIMFTKNKR